MIWNVSQKSGQDIPQRLPEKITEAVPAESEMEGSK